MTTSDTLLWIILVGVGVLLVLALIGRFGRP